mgnify:CR=1 FL=1
MASYGTLWVWGQDAIGWQGLNVKDANLSSPTQISGSGWSTNPKHITVSGVCQFAIKQDGTLWAWGFNNHGRLGHNNTTKYSSPVQIPGTDWNQAQVSGLAHVVAIKVT